MGNVEYGFGGHKGHRGREYLSAGNVVNLHTLNLEL